MLSEHTLDQLRALRLDGMVRAIEDQATSTVAYELPFDDRLTMLVQSEIPWRDDRRVARLLKAAKLKVSAACIEDINWRASRGLDRGLITALTSGDWLRHARNLLITGATGSDKTWLRGYSTSYRSRMATAASRDAWRSSPGWTCWSLTTSPSRPWALRNATTCWSCWTTA